MVASHAPLTGDLAHNSGMCPYWELNQQPFGSQACPQSTELHQPGQALSFYSLQIDCGVTHQSSIYHMYVYILISARFKQAGSYSGQQPLMMCFGPHGFLLCPPLAGKYLRSSMCSPRGAHSMPRSSIAFHSFIGGRECICIV